MAFYNNEYDTGFTKNDETGEEIGLFLITITLAEYRSLVTKAAENETSRRVHELISLRDENKKLNAELSDLRKKLAEVKEAAE